MQICQGWNATVFTQYFYRHSHSLPSHPPPPPSSPLHLLPFPFLPSPFDQWLCKASLLLVSTLFPPYRPTSQQSCNDISDTIKICTYVNLNKACLFASTFQPTSSWSSISARSVLISSGKGLWDALYRHERKFPYVLVRLMFVDKWVIISISVL